MRKQSCQYRIAFFASALAFFVVMLGAYTRLSDAGLGCPDWPGCYGHMLVPTQDAASAVQHSQYPLMPLVAKKAWTEMVHRYFAGTLGILILILAIQALWQLKKRVLVSLLPFILLVLVVFQALLGMWTVTLRLMPIVVMGHLLGGISTLACLWWLSLQTQNKNLQQNFQNISFLKPFAIFGLIILFLQIALGAWTSSNYAALICLDFPMCQAGQWLPHINFHGAFNLFLPLKSGQHGSSIGEGAKMTIHMIHRLGALITFIYLASLSSIVISKNPSKLLRRIAWGMLILLICQLSLGIMNILFLLPLPITVAHNGVAALLLLSVLTLNYFLFTKEKNRKLHG